MAANNGLCFTVLLCSSCEEEWKERAILVEAAVIWVSVYVQHSIKILLELSIVLSMKGK